LWLVGWWAPPYHIPWPKFVIEDSGEDCSGEVSKVLSVVGDGVGAVARESQRVHFHGQPVGADQLVEGFLQDLREDVASIMQCAAR